MNRKIISALLALILCCSLAVSVSAKERNISFVYDELGYLTQEERTALSDFAWEIYQETGVGIFYAYLTAESLETCDTRLFAKGIENYVIMMENETHWYIHLGGQGEIIDLETEEVLRAIYDETETYAEGVMAFMEAAAEYFPPIAAAADDAGKTTGDAQAYFLYDDADLLTDSEEATLVQQLEDVSHACDAQIVIATIASMEGGDIDAFVDDLYDSMGFGYGENQDGVLLLVCMDPREYRILSNGYAGVAIGPDQIDTLCDFMETYLPNGHYVAAFNSFADQCGEMLQYYESGSPFKVGESLAISLVIGLAVGLIVALILKGQLKSVRKQYAAHVYVKQGSMQIALKQDIFLYRNVTRTRRQERAESSGSSGSDGTARSKGGGSF